MKFRLNIKGELYPYGKKTKLLHLKMVFLLLFCFSFIISIKAQNNLISMNKKQTTIKEVLNDIEQKTGCVCFFSEDVKPEMNKRVSIKINNQTLKNVLDELFRQTDLSYQLLGKQISITQRKKMDKSISPSVTKRVTLKGVVTDIETKKPLPDVNIFIEELKTGTVTGEEGSYAINLPQAVYRMRVSYIGYKEQYVTINFHNATEYNIELQSDTHLHEILVTANKKDENVSRTNMGVEKLSISEIKRMPALMGEVDVIKAIQLLPGVQPTAEGSSGYSVRGGSADQNLIVLDNATVYNASHMFGFFFRF